MEALRASGSRAAGKRGGTPNCSVLMLTCGGGAATLCLQRFADRARRWPVKEIPEDIRKLQGLLDGNYERAETFLRAAFQVPE